MTPESTPERFEPHAGRAMASMFDDVSGRYTLLNRLMTLGRDRAWRQRLAAAVPEDARVVLDLCTGNGDSLDGLRRPGRLVLGMDISLGMLEHAASEQGSEGWSPRLVCADGFRLPLPDASVDAVTIAFGIRNLRPREGALAEIARVLRPGGVLAVLEATGPSPGPLAPFHRAHLRHVVPALGQLSPDPSAYRYLAESVLDFGDGQVFESELARAGFQVTGRRSFLAGATRLWATSREGGRGEKPSEPGRIVHAATLPTGRAGNLAQTWTAIDEEVRLWTAAQAVISGVLAVALVWVMVSYTNLSSSLFLEPWQRRAGWVLLGAGTLFAAVRTLVLIGRLGEGHRRR